MSSECEEEEEEVSVYVDFSAQDIDIEHFRSIHVLGVDNEHPVIQLDDQFYQGQYEHPLGTYMFFCESHPPTLLDPVFDFMPEKNLAYAGKSQKLITMRRTFIQPKPGMVSDDVLKKIQVQKDDNAVIEEFSSMEQALKRLGDEWGDKTAKVDNIEDLIEMPDIPDQSRKPLKNDIQATSSVAGAEIIVKTESHVVKTESNI